MKTIIKWFLPSSKKLSQMAADKIKEAVNQTQKEDVIARYAGLASNAVNVQKFICDLLVDGQIDEIESKEIAKRLEPVISKLVELI